MDTVELGPRNRIQGVLGNLQRLLFVHAQRWTAVEGFDGCLLLRSRGARHPDDLRHGLCDERQSREPEVERDLARWRWDRAADLAPSALDECQRHSRGFRALERPD